MVTLKPQGNRLVGSGQTQDSKRPVTVDLARSATGNSYTFEGTVKLGDRILKASSDDLADMSDKDFAEQTAVEEAIVDNPADFREVTPGTLGIRVARTALIDFLKTLRAENVKVQGYSIAPSCEALRRGTVDVQVDIDPDRAADLIAKAKTLPGVTRAGWIERRRRSQPRRPHSGRQLSATPRGKLDRAEARRGHRRRRRQGVRGATRYGGMGRGHRRTRRDREAAGHHGAGARADRGDRHSLRRQRREAGREKTRS